MSDQSRSDQSRSDQSRRDISAANGLDRRGFLKVSSAAAALAVAGSTLTGKSAAVSPPVEAKASAASASGNKDAKGGWFFV